MPTRIVILDSNSVLSPDDRKLVNPRVEALLRDCRNLYPIDAFVPRTVLSEIAYRKCISSERLLGKTQNSTGSLAQILKADTLGEPLSTPPIRFNLYRQYLTWCRRNNVTIVRVPIATINWKRLITDAVQRRAPFSQGDSEKGFRDALILQSAMSVAHSRRDAKVTLITSDERFKEAIREQTEWEIADSLDEYLTVLKLEHSNVTAKRIEIFTTKASQAFFEPNNQNSLFYRADVLGHIRNQFAGRLNAIPEMNVLENLVYFPDRTTLDRYGDDVVTVGFSLYQGTDNAKRHTWNVPVTFVTLFEAQTKHLPGICYVLFRRTVFNVTWSAMVSEEGLFTSQAINDASFVSSILERASVSDLSTYGFPLRFGRLDQSGQAGGAKATAGVRVINPPNQSSMNLLSLLGSN